MTKRIVIAAIVAALLGGIAAYFILRPAAPVVSESAPAMPAKELKNEKPVPIPLATKTIQAYKPAAKTRLKLPLAVQENPDAQVVAASRVVADDHPHTVTTVVDTNTGEVQTFDRRDPLPWLAVNTHGRVGIYYGIKNGVQTVRLQAHQELLQVKAAHFGLIGSVDQPVNAPIGMDYYAGVGVWANW